MSGQSKKSSGAMGPGRMGTIPKLYGATPTFLGLDHQPDPAGAKDLDVVFLGVPWEGEVTWGNYSGCELAVKTIREASARYSAYLPEYDLDAGAELNMADGGDVTVTPTDAGATMKSIHDAAAAVYTGGAIPFTFGGDHSFTPEIVAALSRAVDGPVGVINLDSHLDNMPAFGDDELARCTPMYRICRLSGVRSQSVVHFGVRGPRNAPLQMQLAKEAGATVMTMLQIRRDGLAESIARACQIASEGTKAIYLTICSDILDGSFNPGGPPDFDGLTPGELFRAVNRVTRTAGFRGMDFVEIYPFQDPHNRSAHLAVWALIHGLVGYAMAREE